MGDFNVDRNQVKMSDINIQPHGPVIRPSVKLDKMREVDSKSTTTSVTKNNAKSSQNKHPKLQKINSEAGLQSLFKTIKPKTKKEDPAPDLPEKKESPIEVQLKKLNSYDSDKLIETRVNTIVEYNKVKSAFIKAVTTGELKDEVNEVKEAKEAVTLDLSASVDNINGAIDDLQAKMEKIYKNQDWVDKLNSIKTNLNYINDSNASILLSETGTLSVAEALSKLRGGDTRRA